MKEPQWHADERDRLATELAKAPEKLFAVSGDKGRWARLPRGRLYRSTPHLALVLMGLALGCEKASPPLAPSAAKVPELSARSSASSGDQTLIRWDILGSGGDTPLATDNSKITLTGSGTFQLADDGADVTGGGTWTTFGPAGKQTASGSYTVTQLISFNVAPGGLPNLPAARAGVTYLRIAYSDGERGTLVVSCRLPGSPPAVAEGVSASKGSLYFWNVGDPQFTLFRVLSEED
jgi:hypothetical protein